MLEILAPFFGIIISFVFALDFFFQISIHYLGQGKIAKLSCVSWWNGYRFWNGIKIHILFSIFLIEFSAEWLKCSSKLLAKKASDAHTYTRARAHTFQSDNFGIFHLGMQVK